MDFQTLFSPLVQGGKYVVQNRETRAINKLCVREILSLSFVCGAYFFEFRGRNLVCFVIAYNFNGKYAPEAGKTRMCTAFFMRVSNWFVLSIRTQVMLDSLFARSSSAPFRGGKKGEFRDWTNITLYCYKAASANECSPSQ